MAKLTSETYSVARPTGRCAHTGRPIAPGEHYIAALGEREGEDALERVDYSLTAWSDGARPVRLFGFWRSVMPEADAKPRLFIDDDDLLALFDQIGDEAEDDDGARDAFRFVLALILLRKRLLRQTGTAHRDGRRWMLVKRRGEPADAPPAEVLDPDLDAQRVAMVTEQLGAALRGEQ